MAIERNVVISPKQGINKGKIFNARMMSYGLYEVNDCGYILEYHPKDVTVIGKRVYNEDEGVHEILYV